MSKPYADSRLAKVIEKRILELSPKKTQAEIAHEAGFLNPNVLSMMKSGANKVPLDRVPGLAKALEADPRLMFRLACEQAGGEALLRTVEEIFGTVVSRNEIVWLEAIREASGNSDPRLTSRGQAAIRGIFGK